MNFFFLAFELFGLIAILFIITTVQIVRLIRERKKLTKLRIQKVTVFTCLFLLTFSHSFTNRIIEKADWLIFENKRLEIVEQVKNEKLKPNVDWNGWVCELPFEFPVVSNGGNDIGIFKSKTDSTVTVQFWVFRNFFSHPSTYFIYTENNNVIERIEKKISNRPKDNWKLKENWYRVYGDF